MCSGFRWSATLISRIPRRSSEPSGFTDKNTPIDFILHTPGGLVLAASQIAKAIKRHPAKTTVFVPHYAMSGGTLIALAANEIVMDTNAVLGPIDPQLGTFLQPQC